jgi:GrpB protein
MIRSSPCHVVVLLPSTEAIAAREAGRENKGYLDGWTLESHQADFVGGASDVGLWLDTTEQTPEETVDEILARTTFESSPFEVVEYDEPGLRPSSSSRGRSARWSPPSAPRSNTSAALPSPPGREAARRHRRRRALGGGRAGCNRVPATARLHASRRQGNPGPRGVPSAAGRDTAPPVRRLAGSEPLRAHLAFRDYLREHPEAGHEYAAPKRQLAERHRDDRLGYTDAKSEFVLGVLELCARS